LLAFSVSLSITGGGIRTTEKTICDGLRLTEHSYIEFKNVWLKRIFHENIRGNVWVRPSKPNENMIIVKIDPELSEFDRIITVIPDFLSRIFRNAVSYDAKKVIIWVPDEKNKIMCEKWIKSIEKQYFINKKLQHKQVFV